MSLGEKLTKLRKENNYTQEQLAEILGVSRQAISKWESNAAYPETDKLIKLGELYNCSMDYLLKDNAEASSPAGSKIELNFKSLYFEKKSKKMLWGLPLWHINIGVGRTAKGIFALGLFAKGIVSVGLLSLGIVSFGLLSLGLLALGTLALGVIAAGSISAGIIAFGAICVGLLSIGAISVGEFSIGALCIGNYLAIGDNARAAIAIGKTEAIGSVYQASAVTANNRQEILSLLDQNVPAVFVWLKELVKMFI